MGVDRVTDRFKAEEVQPRRAEDQKVFAAAGLAMQLVAQIGLADDAAAVPFGKTVVQLRVRQAVAVPEIPFVWQILQLGGQACLVAQPDLRSLGLQTCLGRARQIRVQAESVPGGAAVQLAMLPPVSGARVSRVRPSSRVRTFAGMVRSLFGSDGFWR